MSNPNECPTRERLQSLLSASLPKDELDTIALHVESCAACQRTLEALSPASQSWEKLVVHLEHQPVSSDDALQKVIEQAKGSSPAFRTEAEHCATPHAVGCATEQTQAEPTATPRSSDLAFLEPPTKSDEIGRLKHYQILEVIGKGGFGIVLKAFDEKLRRIVAIKALAAAYSANGAARKRFIREAQTAAAVKNEHVVGIYDVQDEAEPPYLVMEMIDGISLQDKLDKKGPLSVKEILRIGLQAAEGLAAAHKQGLVHRDIKPANILLENGVERVKITDFGLARAVDDASVTQSGTVAGTPMYMSPEQAEGLPIDHRSDLFSLGTVLYAMCTGHPPFRASGTHAVLKRVIDASPRPIREINNEVPEWLCDIVSKLHAKKPEDRFQTAKEVAELLEQHLAHLQQPSQAPMPTPVRPGNFQRETEIEAVQAALRGPVIGLTAAGLLNWIGFLAVTVVLGLVPSLRPPPYAIAIAVVIMPLGSTLILWGAAALYYGHSRRWGVFAAVLALIVGPGYVIGLPVGIWTLAVLRRPKLRAALDAARLEMHGAEATAPVAHANWRRGRRIAAVAVATVGVFFAYSAIMISNLPPERVSPAGVHWLLGAVAMAALLACPFLFFEARGRYYGAVALLIVIYIVGAVLENTDLAHFIHRQRYWVEFTPDDTKFTLKVVPVVEGADPEVTIISHAVLTDWHAVHLDGKKKLRLEAGRYWIAAIVDNRIAHYQTVTIDKPGAVDFPWAAEFAKKKQREEGWVQLFNGADFSGWYMSAKENNIWTVENGAMVNRIGTAKAAFWNPVYSKGQDYGNFHLRMRARLNAQGKASVGFGKDGGYGVRLEGNGNVCLWQGHDNKRTDLQRASNTTFMPGAWFLLEAIVQNQQILIKVNGKHVIDWHSRDAAFSPSSLRFGAGFTDTEFFVKGIEVKMLPLGESGWVQLFNGKELKNWEAFPADGWKVENGLLVSNGGRASISLHKPLFGDGICRLEYKLAAHVTANLGVRTQAKKPKAALWLGSSGKEGEKSGSIVVLDAQAGSKIVAMSRADVQRNDEWQVAELIMRGNEMIVKIDGLETARHTFEDLPARGNVGLYVSPGLMQIREIAIKELPPEPAAPMPKGDWVSLFDGKDLKPWVAENPKAWRVEGSLLIGELPESAPSATFLRLDRELGDFSLKFEVRIDKLFAQINVRTEPARGPWKGYRWNFSGHLWSNVTSRYLIQQAKRDPLMEGKWHTVEMTAIGDRFTYKVDGKDIASGIDTEIDKHLARGWLRIQLGPGTKIAFKKIEFKDLTSPAVSVFQPLFNSKNLDGWTPHEKLPNHWKVEDGILVGRGPESYLYGKDVKNRPFHLRAVARINDGGYGAVVVHTSAGTSSGAWANINSTHDSRKTGDLYGTGLNFMTDPGPGKVTPPKPGEWFTLDLVSRKGLVVVKVNDVVSSQIDIGDRFGGTDQIALYVGGDKSVVEFRSIEVKELP